MFCSLGYCLCSRVALGAGIVISNHMLQISNGRYQKIVDLALLPKRVWIELCFYLLHSKRLTDRHFTLCHR